MPHLLPSSCGAQSIEPDAGSATDPVLLFALASAFTQAVGNPATALAASLGAVRQNVGDVADDEGSIARALDRSSASAGRIIAALRSASALLRTARGADTIMLPELIRSVADSFAPGPDIAHLDPASLPNAPIRAIADRRHVERILYEMLAHALHRMTEDKSPAPTGLSIGESDGEVWLALSWPDAALRDTETLFSLEQAAPGTRRPGALGIARALAIANDGRLWAEAIDGGIRLTCVLPAQPPAT